MKDKRQSEILGILLFALSFFILLSLVSYNPNEEISISPNIERNNIMGIMGIYISHYFIKLGFGVSSLVLPIIGFAWGWFLFHKQNLNILIRTSFYSLLFMLHFSLSLGVLLKLININEYTLIGLIGGVIRDFLWVWFKPTGTILYLLVAWLIIVRAYFDLNYYRPLKILLEEWDSLKRNYFIKKDNLEKEIKKKRHTERLKEKIEQKRIKETENFKDDNLIKKESTIQNRMNTESGKIYNQSKTDIEDDSLVFKSDTKNNESQILKSFKDDSADNDNDSISVIKDKINVEEIAQNEEVDIDTVADRMKPKRKYQLPSSDLLTDPVSISENLSNDELVERANYLTQSLSTFGVEGKVVNVHPGPVITLFEVEPAEGVRVNKFVALSDDLKRVMEANVRVIAPIPGKSSVGIEIPNQNPATVYFKSIVNSQEFANSESLLTLAIGKTTIGEISTLDLSKMPHLLIAGTTGSGKSVCINTIICSIIYRATPSEVKFVMIDPKKVEMTLYRELEGYHLMKMEDISEPIITSVENAILSLKALEKEMDRRYDVLADAIVRNITEYNHKMEQTDDSIMPYIVLVIDELADLMMLSAKDVEAPIARLAQLARAVGIHLVIATQRPSVDVITGVIKANFPSRIAFQVASKIDSRTIIDQPGADKLIGRGDMLHLGTGSSDVFRMHNAFLTLEEIRALMNHVKTQPKPEELILPSIRDVKSSEFGIEGSSDADEMFNDAVSLVITHQQGSISLLQRRLKVGYSRAARLIDQMEQVGVVGPFTGSKAREVLVDESYLEMIRD